MKINKILFLSLLALITFCLAASLSAEDEKKKDDGVLSGSFMLGYRGVDVDGKMNKYKEDYNLEDGPSLTYFKLHFLPSANSKFKKLFDRVDISMHEIGVEPFQSISLSAVKYGTYKFKFDRRKSSYFYNDVLEGHDFQTFDFDRVQNSASLKVWLCKAARLYVGFENYTKKGNSTTSLDINRDEFEFDRPVNELSYTTTVGLDMSLKGFTLLLEEKIQDYKNENHMFLPGFSYGENSGDLANLGYFFQDQPYDFRTFTHTAKLTARPSSNFLIKASGVVSTQDLRLSYSESQMGTTYMGTPYNYEYMGDGEFDRKMQLFDLDMSYLVTSKVALTAAVRYHNMEQDGTFDVYDVEMPASLDYNTLGVEGGIQFQPTSRIAASIGVRHETREVNTVHEGVGNEETTKRTGFFGNVKLRLSKKLRLTGDYQYGSYKDPFTPISPTDFHRARFTARYKAKSYYFTGSYVYQLSENDIDDGWKSERSQASLRVGYYKKKVKLGIGYGLIYIKNEGDRNFVFYGSPATWEILNEGRANLFDAYFQVKANKMWMVGVYGNYYKNDGYWEVERYTIKPFLEINFDGGFIGQLAYRYIDFKENIYGYNNYNANIFEISFGYRW
jgi:hypothetical protein